MFYFDRIKPLLEGTNIKEHPLEKEIGLAKSSIYNWNNQKNKISIESLIKLATYFGVSTDYLLGLDDSKSSKPQMPCEQNKSSKPQMPYEENGITPALDTSTEKKEIFAGYDNTSAEKRELMAGYDMISRKNQLKLLRYLNGLLKNEKT